MVYVIKRICGDADFLSVSAYMDGRNHLQCRFRWRNILRPGIKLRKKFVWQEDLCLYLAVSSRGTSWKQLTPHLDDVCGRGRTDLTARERFINFLDPKLFYKDFSESEQKGLEQTMVKYFPDRIDPPSGKKHNKYALSPKEWKFFAKKFRSSGRKRSSYQLKREWHRMQRRSKRRQITKQLKEGERASGSKGTKRHFNKVNGAKAGNSK